jgi:hypothetical protein
MGRRKSRPKPRAGSARALTGGWLWRGKSACKTWEYELLLLCAGMRQKCRARAKKNGTIKSPAAAATNETAAGITINRGTRMKIKDTLVQCQHCAHQFRSRLIQFANVESFTTSTVEGNHEPCPSCGKRALVDRAHMAYRLEDGTIGGAGKHFMSTSSH